MNCAKCASIISDSLHANGMVICDCGCMIPVELSPEGQESIIRNMLQYHDRGDADLVEAYVDCYGPQLESCWVCWMDGDFKFPMVDAEGLDALRACGGYDHAHPALAYFNQEIQS